VTAINRLKEGIRYWKKDIKKNTIELNNREYKYETQRMADGFDDLCIIAKKKGWLQVPSLMKIQ